MNVAPSRALYSCLGRGRGRRRLRDRPSGEFEGKGRLVPIEESAIKLSGPSNPTNPTNPTKFEDLSIMCMRYTFLHAHVLYKKLVGLVGQQCIGRAFYRLFTDI